MIDPSCWECMVSGMTFDIAFDPGRGRWEPYFRLSELTRSELRSEKVSSIEWDPSEHRIFPEKEANKYEDLDVLTLSETKSSCAQLLDLAPTGTHRIRIDCLKRN